MSDFLFYSQKTMNKTNKLKKQHFISIKTAEMDNCAYSFILRGIIGFLSVKTGFNVTIKGTINRIYYINIVEIFKE